jgi:SAM-dependent methyltransferase
VNRLDCFIKKEAFFPGLVGLLINPFYFARKELAAHLGDLARSLTGKTLDVGCGSKPYERLCNPSEYVGMELDTAENRKKKLADCFYDGHRFPFEANTFDSAIATQVFEHIFEPTEFLGEIYRILKPGGMLLMTTPFIWDEHEQPMDFARYSSFGVRSLVIGAGFEILEQRKSLGDLRVIFQLMNAYLYKVTLTRNKWLNLAAALFLMAPWNILGEILGRLMPKNPDLYLDNIILAKKA